MILRSGDTDSFEAAWRTLESDGKRYHFRRGDPKNQVQYAFQNHWRVFREVLGPLAQPITADGRRRRALEAGCGRGSMAAFIADAGFETVLLDYSNDVLGVARLNFESDALSGAYACGDALCMPFADGSFDIVTSIGLLEHFADIKQAVSEQIRILRPGGVFLGYVVPESPTSVQRLATPVNFVLAAVHKVVTAWCRHEVVSGEGKRDLFRTAYTSTHFHDVLDDLGCRDRGAFGMFPVPLVSHSPAFPFTPMGPRLEAGLCALWRATMKVRQVLYKRDPWICDESWGLAFLVWARKPERGNF